MESTFDTFDVSDKNIDLPSILQLKKFSQVRCKEIEIMKKSLASSSNTKLAFQKLPRHMRRRAMSHNAKRLPRRLREIHLNQMKKSGLPPKQKRPSRKYRRKPSNLLLEYTKRQSKIRWLNTHIWHAKRFHMIEKWGFKLPLCACDKAFTACYRATKNHCLLQDISYFQCIEMKGDEEIMSKIKVLTDSNNGLSIMSKVFKSGFREGTTIFLKYSANVKEVIGPVNFMWNLNEVLGKSCLWIWIHPAFYDEVLNSIIEYFKLIKSETGEKHCNKEKSIEVNELRNKLSRFRLSGSLSNSVIHDCFKPYNSKSLLSEWYTDFYKSKKETLLNQNKYWNDIKMIPSTTVLSPNMILPIIINDPRLNAPRMRTKSEHVFSNEIDHEIIDNFSSLATVSPLWDENILNIVLSNKVTDADIGKLRNNMLVPASDLTELSAPVPIILTQRPGNRSENSGYSSGWDIILPSVWARPIWVSLIMCGARSGGLREFRQNCFETGKPDYLYPDTEAGKKEEESVSKQFYDNYFKKPPNKRTNFGKFKIESPFRFNWKLLIENWSNREIQKFSVIRDRKLLDTVQNCIRSGKIVELSDDCLIPVQVKCKKGTVKKFTIICLPKKEDLKNNCTLTEPKCPDPNKNLRKNMRDQHKKLLKRLKQRRKLSRRLGKLIKPTDVADCAKYTEEMRKLWIPEVKNLRRSCSREIIGFIKDGGFSFSSGFSKGIGFIAGASLSALISSGCKNMVLVRNTNSRQYYKAELSVIVDL